MAKDFKIENKKVHQKKESKILNMEIKVSFKGTIKKKKNG